MSSNTHVLEMPKGFLGIRIAQLVIGLIELGLVAYLISNTLGFTFSAQAWAILCCIATLIIVIYNIVAMRFAQSMYNKWAVLSLDVALVIFWLSAMGSLAALRAAFNISVTLTKRYSYYWAGGIYLAILSVTAAVAAIEMILFIASLAMVATRVNRQRIQNAPAAGLNMEKLENGQVQSQQQQQPQVPYSQNGQQYQQQAAPQQQQFQQQPQFQQQQQYQPQDSNQQTYNNQTGSPVHQPYQPAMSPPPQQYAPTPTQSPAPQYIAPQPQYPVQPPPHGIAEAPAAEYRGTA